MAEQKKVEADPRSTWGATEAYKAAWRDEHGNKAPAGNASKAEWVEYAQTHGMSQEEAEAMTATDLKERFSSLSAQVAPAQGSNTPVSTAEADAASGQAAPGGGVASGTAEGSADTTGTSSAGARAKGDTGTASSGI